MSLERWPNLTIGCRLDLPGMWWRACKPDMTRRRGRPPPEDIAMGQDRVMVFRPPEEGVGGSRTDPHLEVAVWKRSRRA